MPRSTPFVFAALSLMPGCELLDSLNERDAVVDVLVTHHRTPDGGEIPVNNDAVPRFVTDMGWEVFLHDAYVTTTGVTVHNCDGTQESVDMFWGALPEKLDRDDLSLTGIGAVTVLAGVYCGVTVHYGPFMPSSDADDWSMGTPDAIGSSVYLAGAANKDGQSIEFTWRSEMSLDAYVDLNSDPLDWDGEFNLDEKLTVTKTYDRFFDGVEFDDFELGDVDSLVLDTLSHETGAVDGTDVKP